MRWALLPNPMARAGRRDIQKSLLSTKFGYTTAVGERVSLSSPLPRFNAVQNGPDPQGATCDQDRLVLFRRELAATMIQ
jgi:hypothetical protein